MPVSRFQAIPDIYCTTYHIDQLELLCRAAREAGVGQLRFAPGGRINVSDLSERKLKLLRDRLEPSMSRLPNNGLSALYTCSGCGECQHGLRDTQPLAERLAQLPLPGPLPAKLKGAIAGCPRCCTMPAVRDIGIIPTSKGWRLLFGGNGGSRPRLATCIGTDLSETDLLETIRAAVAIYQAHARPGMRTARFLEFYGERAFMEKLAEKTPLLTQVKE